MKNELTSRDRLGQHKLIFICIEYLPLYRVDRDPNLDYNGKRDLSFIFAALAAHFLLFIVALTDEILTYDKL